ncbi:MAG: preprotein translocase subunit SecG [Pseudomonadota bacterium]
MDIWLTLILTVHVLVALGIIFLVLLQHGKGADMGAAFGGGSSGSLFGATGSANFLSRTTAALAVVFFLTSLGLAYVATHKPKMERSVMQGVTSQPATAVAPAGEVPKPADAAAGPKANDVPK